MSRRTTIFLLLVLAAGVGYGLFGIPFFLPFVADDVEAAVEEPPKPRISDADEVHYRLLKLKPGMNWREVDKVFGDLLVDKFLHETGNALVGITKVYQISPGVTLHLRFTRGKALSDAELRNGKKVVARIAAEQMTPGNLNPEN